MGRRLNYKLGSFYRTDDYSGFPTRAEYTKKRWDGYIVDKKLWDPRQPQDLVRGVPDKQSVPEARPLAPAQFVGPIFIQVQANYGPGTSVISLQTVGGVTVGDAVGLVMSDGTIYETIIQAILPNAQVQISPALVGYLPSGNLLQDYRVPASGF